VTTPTSRAAAKIAVKFMFFFTSTCFHERIHGQSAIWMLAVTKCFKK
jgi:predicted secreted Zn-dependent protease